jgi:hypothetical protein
MDALLLNKRNGFSFLSGANADDNVQLRPFLQMKKRAKAFIVWRGENSVRLIALMGCPFDSPVSKLWQVFE